MLFRSALVAGGNAYINIEGRLVIRPYDTSHAEAALEGEGLYYSPWMQAIQVNGGAYNPWDTGDVLEGGTYAGLRSECHILYAWLGDPAIDTDDITITGIATGKDDDDQTLYGTQGYVLNVENPVIVGNETEALRLAGEVLVGMKFRMFSGAYIGDPTIEFMDECVLIDRHGNTYISVITDVTYAFRGATELKNSAEPVIRNNSVYSANSKTVQRARRITERMLSAYDIGIQNLTQLMSAGIGYYVTEEVQSDGSKIYYEHDQPTLAQSQYILKKTAQGVAQSVDGGQTWTSGADKYGNMVMNTIAAKGISADWITTGALTVTDGLETIFSANMDTQTLLINAKDLRGNDMFRLDSGTGEVDIVAHSFSLTSGATLASTLSDAEDYADDRAALALSDAQNYTDAQLGLYDPTLAVTEQLVFDRLTNEGARQGIFMENGEIYINMSYLRSGILQVGRTVNGTYQNTFSANSLTGEVNIVANSFSLTSGATLASTLSDAESYTDTQLSSYSPISHLTQAQIYDKLTNGGTTQGIFLAQDGKLYINWEYAVGGTLKLGGPNNGNGLLEVYDASNALSVTLANTGIRCGTEQGLYGASYYGGTGVVLRYGSDQHEAGKIDFQYQSIYGNIAILSRSHSMGSSGTVNSGIILSGNNIKLCDENADNFMRCFVSSGTRYVVCEGTSSGWYSTSDARLKQNIQRADIDYIYVLSKLRVVEFDWKENGKHIPAGFVAQEVEEILPNLVGTDPETDEKSISLQGLIPYLVGAFQRQQAIIEEQRSRIDSLEARLAKLESLVERMIDEHTA